MADDEADLIHITGDFYWREGMYSRRVWVLTALLLIPPATPVGAVALGWILMGSITTETEGEG